MRRLNDLTQVLGLNDTVGVAWGNFNLQASRGKHVRRHGLLNREVAASVLFFGRTLQGKILHDDGTGKEFSMTAYHSSG